MNIENLQDLLLWITMNGITKSPNCKITCITCDSFDNLSYYYFWDKHLFSMCTTCRVEKHEYLSGSEISRDEFEILSIMIKWATIDANSVCLLVSGFIGRPPSTLPKVFGLEPYARSVTKIVTMESWWMVTIGPKFREMNSKWSE